MSSPSIQSFRSHTIVRFQSELWARGRNSGQSKVVGATWQLVGMTRPSSPLWQTKNYVMAAFPSRRYKLMFPIFPCKLNSISLQVIPDQARHFGNGKQRGHRMGAEALHEHCQEEDHSLWCGRVGSGHLVPGIPWNKFFIQSSVKFFNGISYYRGNFRPWLLALHHPFNTHWMGEHIKWRNSKSVKLPRPRDVFSLPEVKFMVMVCLWNMVKVVLLLTGQSVL